MSELLAMRRADGVMIPPPAPIPYRMHIRSEARGERPGVEPQAGMTAELPLKFACSCDACLKSGRIITPEECSLEGDRTSLLAELRDDSGAG